MTSSWIITQLLQVVSCGWNPSSNDSMFFKLDIANEAFILNEPDLSFGTLLTAKDGQAYQFCFVHFFILPTLAISNHTFCMLFAILLAFFLWFLQMYSFCIGCYALHFENVMYQMYQSIIIHIYIWIQLLLHRHGAVSSNWANYHNLFRTLIDPSPPKKK